MGDLDVPLGGVTTNEPNGSWVPTSNNENLWISIGPNNTCQAYDAVFGESPPWSITGKGNEELTRHVMCCDTQIASGGEEAAQAIYEADEGENGEQEVPLVIWPSVAQPTSGGEEGDGDDSQQVPLVADAVEYAAEALKNAEMYNPVWHNRSSGWHGLTYDDAFTFCAGIGSNHDVCPYEVLCPGGSFHAPYGGFISGDQTGSWAPVVGAFNSWVQIITEGQICVPWENLHGGGRPDWGIDSLGQAEDITRYILCCEMYQLDDNTASSGMSGMSSDDVTEKYAPTWFDRSDGWDGSKYVDAIVFCASKDSYILCPYEACEFNT